MGFHGGSGNGEDPGWEESPGARWSEDQKPGVDLRAPGVQECNESGHKGSMTWGVQWIWKHWSSGSGWHWFEGAEFVWQSWTDT